MNHSHAATESAAKKAESSDGERDFFTGMQTYIRRNPARALAIAAGAGFLLHSAPIGRLVGGLLRVSFALLQPALIIAGGVKVLERVQHRQIL